MDPTLISLAEKSIELTASIRNLSVPNPFRSLKGMSPWWLDTDPQDFYAIPASAPRLKFHTVWAGLNRTRARFSFPSYDQSPYPENNTVHGLANLSTRGPRASLIIVHGHMMSNFAGLEWFAIPAARLGLDVYFLALPYHMQRTPKGAWSGQFHLNANVEGTALAFRQGVRDLRALISWIEQEQGGPVGLVGVSLGAYTCCMTSVVDNRPQALVSILGGASLAQIHWDGYQMGRHKHQLLAGGVTRQKLEKYWSVLSPGNWKPLLDREQVLMVAGKYDPVVTPRNVWKLWDAWEKPFITWYPCGHGTIVLNYVRVVRDIITFLKFGLLKGRG